MNPATGEQLVIEMNPRVSRSSALASKATGFPIARIGTKVAVGYRLDELPNDITRTTPASFEPVLDYVVVKIPRFAFEKFPTADPTLTTQMKSVGEVMAIGRTFKEAFQKGLRGLESGPHRVGHRRHAGRRPAGRRLARDRRWPRSGRRRRSGSSRSSARSSSARSVEAIAERTGIDPWFLHQMARAGGGGDGVGGPTDRGPAEPSDERRASLRRMKRLGFSDRQLADLRGIERGGDPARCATGSASARPTRRWTPAPASSPRPRPYLYSSYDEENEARGVGDRTVVILGSGPNRIGQGVEFDYCCVRAAHGVPASWATARSW